MEEIKAVVFDIDGTITPATSSWTAMTEDMGGSVEEHLLIFKGFKEGKISYEDSRKKLTKLWQDTGNGTRPKLESIFKNRPIYQEAKEVIEFLQNKELKVAFISGSMSFYTKIIADRFSISDYYANGELIFDDVGNLVDFTFPYDESKRKLEYLYEFCNKNSLSSSQVIAVGDSENDIEIFKETKRGIVVGNTKPEALVKVSWKQANNLSEIKKLLAPLLKN